MLRAGLIAILLVACGAPAPTVSIPEMEHGEVAGAPVGVGPIFERAEFRKGKRVKIRWATLYLQDRANQTIQKQEVAAGDDVYIGRDRWTVKAVTLGTADTRGGVLLERVED